MLKTPWQSPFSKSLFHPLTTAYSVPVTWTLVFAVFDLWSDLEFRFKNCKQTQTCILELVSSVTYLELWKEKKSYLRVQHYVFDQISVLRKSQAEGFILTNGSKGKYNLNCRLVKQKSQKPCALACYRDLQLSVHSSNRMTSSILWELSAGFRPGASTHNHKVVIPCPSSSVILSQRSSSCSRRNTNAVSVLLTGYWWIVMINNDRGLETVLIGIAVHRILYTWK